MRFGLFAADAKNHLKYAASILCAAGLAWGECEAKAASARMTVSAAEPGPLISPMLYGIFFEEINCAGDGGIYPEMVRNRSFEESEKPTHWMLHAEGGATASMQVQPASPLTASNRHSLKLTVEDRLGRAGIVNGGFWGMALKQGEKYELKLQARSQPKGIPLTITLEGTNGEIYASEVVKGLSQDWGGFEATLKSRSTDMQARLVISPAQGGVVWLDLVSLMPEDLWKKSRMRPDLARMLEGLRPGFMRFPGGCWVEGETMGLAYRWKETIGRLQDRRTQYNIWQYFSTHGLGYHEYLQLCEDLGAEPLFVVNCGMSHKETVPMSELGPWVQDALDALEYANGPANSRWGSLRARNGHAKPFNLRYVEIGNENGGKAYAERYAVFYRAIKMQYPAVHLIANDWGGVPTNAPVEIVDEHYYNNPGFFIANAHKYDTYPRNGPRIYVGEYAVTQNCGQGNLMAALGEAAFMLGMERNSDVVTMSSYAPLFANVHYKKWNPDLINFDSARVYGTPSYYVQKLFAENRPGVVLRTKVEAAEAMPVAPRGGVGLGTWNTQAEYKDFKVESAGKVVFGTENISNMADFKQHGGAWEMKDGVIAQTTGGENRRITFGDTNWGDYTFSLKARKLSGAEGFLILFHAADNDNYFWWNLGGWGNSTHAIEQATGGGKSRLGAGAPGRIELNRWYDIRVELSGMQIRCYLDGKLINDEKVSGGGAPLHALAGRFNDSGEIALKVVNVSAEDYDTQLLLEGFGKVKSRAKMTVLTGNPADENSLEQPKKISPRTSQIENAGSTFKHSFPAHSLTILRLEAAK